MPDKMELNEQALHAEIARLNKTVHALMDRAESSTNIQGSDFNLFHTAITLEDQVHRRTDELEAAMRENEKITRALRESEDHYRAFFLGAKIPMLLIEPTDGRIVDANAAAESFYGYSLNQIKEMNIDQINTLTREEIAQEMSNAEHEKKSAFHFRHRLANGEVRDVEVHSGSVNFKEHHLLYSIVHDITERHKAEVEVKEQLHFIEQLIEAIPNPLFYKDDQGRYLGCNHAFEQYIGSSRQELVGKSVYELSPKELADRYHAADKALFDKPGVQTYEAKVQSADGEHKDVLFYKATFNKSDGSLGGLVGVILDITERKRAEESMRITASVFDNSQEAILISDVNNAITDVNPAFTLITGYSPARRCSARNPKLLSSGRQDKAFYAAMWQSLEQKRLGAAKYGTGASPAKFMRSYSRLGHLR
jgi:PAS domain S-box-containing protein